MDVKLQPGRHLEVEGTYNVRDLGGYGTSDGRRTRWQTLVRADSLHRVPPAYQAALIDYGIRTVIDLRTTAETLAEPNVFSASPNVSYLHHDMAGDTEPYDGWEDLEGLARIVAIYTNRLDRRLGQIGETLAAIAAPGALPAIYHCAGGQDRTGLITALLLGIAGVPEETIAEDYALTAHYYINLFLGKDAPPDVDPADYTWQAYQQRSCPPEAMLSTLEHLGDRYGGVEGYVRTAGLDSAQIEGLRNAMVE